MPPASVVVGADVHGQTDRETCIFCGSDRLMRQRALVAGFKRPICATCGGVGRTLLDEGALEGVLHCLHLTAMELEAFAPDYPALDFVYQRWIARIRRKFREGEFRELCTCNGCNGRPVAGAVGDVFAHFGMSPETFADTMPFNVLKALPDGRKLKASDGSEWKVVDEIARRVVAGFQIGTRPALGKLALSARPVHPGSWVDDAASGRLIYRHVGEAEKAERDERARAHWRTASYGLPDE